MTTLVVAARWTGSELAWLAWAVVRLVRFVPGAVLVWLGLGMVGAVLLGYTFLCLWILLPVVLGLVGRWWPHWLDTHVADRVRRRRIRHRVIGSWEDVRTGAGLPDAMTLGPRPRWRGSELVLRPILPPGVTVEDVEKAADRLAAGFGAVRVRVIAPAPGQVEVLARFTDPLAVPFTATVPAIDGPVVWDRVRIGLREDGQPWEWSIRVSTLTAGASGSGKGSLLWGLVVGLGPAVKAGLVRLYGVDLKGGMELAMGQGLFERVAVTTGDATDLLTEIADALRARARGLAGVTRQHEPTRESPHVVVVVDELAALVAYADRKDRDRAEAALNVILSQGRAVGFTVMAFVQDPKKETVRNRGLFPASLGLRLRGREEVAMVLGDGARAAGAACDRIPLSMPGVGYVLPDGESTPVRVRAGFVTDDAIRLAVHRFGTRKHTDNDKTDDIADLQLPAQEERVEQRAGGQTADHPDDVVAAESTTRGSRRRGGARRSPQATRERTETW